MKKFLIGLVILVFMTSYAYADWGEFRRAMEELEYSIVPEDDNSLNLGSSSIEFAHIYTNDLTVSDTASIDGTAGISGNLDMNGNDIVGIGSALTGTKNTALILSIPDQDANTNAGVGLSIEADDGGTGTTGGAGGTVTINAGDAKGTGDNAGGNVVMDFGKKTGTGMNGYLTLSRGGVPYGTLASGGPSGTAPAMFGLDADGATAWGTIVGAYNNLSTDGANLFTVVNNAEAGPSSEAILSIQSDGTGWDMLFYDATNDANPDFKIGSSDTDELHIQSVFDTGAQTLDYVQFTTDSDNAGADKGAYKFNVDGADVFTIIDNGIEVNSGGIDWATGNVIYVPLGSSIETAVTNATAGDTLILASGTYTITDDIDIGKAINIVGQSRATTKIACVTDAKNVFDITADDVSIRNLSILYECTTGHGANRGIKVDATGGAVIRNVFLENLEIQVSGSDGQITAVEFLDASGLLLRSHVLVAQDSGSTSISYGVYHSAAATAEEDIELIIIDSEIDLEGYSTVNAYGVRCIDTGSSNIIENWILRSVLEAWQRGNGDAIAVNADGDDAEACVEWCSVEGVADGAGDGYDLVQANTAMLEVINSSLLGGQVTGTISHAGSASGTILYAGSNLYVGGVGFAESDDAVAEIAGGGIANQVIEDESLADAGVLSTGLTHAYGMLIVSCTTNGESGIYRVENQTITAISQNANFTITKDNVGTINVYWDTDQYKVQNNDGAPRNITVALYGT